MNIKKLIKLAIDKHLVSIEIQCAKYPNCNERDILYTIKKQLGNNKGCIIEIDFNNDNRIFDIRFEIGNYNDVATLKRDINEVFDIILNASK